MSSWLTIIRSPRTRTLLECVPGCMRNCDSTSGFAGSRTSMMVVPKGARVSSGTARTTQPVVLAVGAEQVDADLRSLGDRQSATRYLGDLKLKKAELVQLAKELNVPVRSSNTVAEIRDLIVEHKVGHRLAHDAILRRA